MTRPGLNAPAVRIRRDSVLVALWLIVMLVTLIILVGVLARLARHEPSRPTLHSWVPAAQSGERGFGGGTP